jgi:ElaB/YqjD/DUF883 family membrane-anchored ribosome-binding protein
MAQNKSTHSKDKGDMTKDTMNMNKDTTKSSREIESEIDQTRTAMSGDIRSLSDKLSPAALKQEAKEAMVEAKDAVVEKAIETKDVVVDKAVEVTDAIADKAIELKDEAAEKLSEAKDVAVETYEQVSEQAKDIGAATWRFTKANAVPLALIGVGTGLLIANRRRSSEPDRLTPGLYEVEVEQYELADDEDLEWPTGQVPPRRVSGRNGGVSRGRGQSSGRNAASASSARRAARKVGERVEDLTTQAGHQLDRAESKIGSGAAQSADYLRQGWKRARDVSSNFADENPFAVALATLAAGVGIGLMLPKTERETRLMRPTRQKLDRLMGDAKEAATDVAQIAKDTANESMRAVT